MDEVSDREDVVSDSSDQWRTKLDAVFDYIADHKKRPVGDLRAWLNEQTKAWVLGSLTDDNLANFELMRISFPCVFGECSRFQAETPETIII